MKRVWDCSFHKSKFKLEFNIGLYPPGEDDYYSNSWSFYFNFCGIGWGCYTYLDMIEEIK